MSDIRPIRTEVDYDWALTEVEQYFDNEPELGTPESDRFEILVTLIEAYEEKHWPIEPPDPVDMIKYAIDEMGHSQTELAELLGSRSRASEILNRKRPLTIKAAHKLHTEWHIPAAALIKPYHLDSDYVPDFGNELVQGVSEAPAIARGQIEPPRVVKKRLSKARPKASHRAE